LYYCRIKGKGKERIIPVVPPQVKNEIKGRAGYTARHSQTEKETQIAKVLLFCGLQKKKRGMHRRSQVRRRTFTNCGSNADCECSAFLWFAEGKGRGLHRPSWISRMTFPDCKGAADWKSRAFFVVGLGR
jgi:hypothetical protein